MISPTTAERQGKLHECQHTRSITCLPASGSWFFCDDCGTYLPIFDCPSDITHNGRWKDHILGKDNAHRLW